MEALKTGQSISADLLSSGIEAEGKIIEKKVTRSSISFYLNSIIYSGPVNWVLWINGNKVTNDKNSTDIEITRIDQHSIDCMWSTGYGKFVDIISAAVENNNIPNSMRVEINDNIAKVFFTLKPNQSFEVSNRVFIKEGK